MTIPHTFRVGALVLAATSFYTYVGQMVPQKEVLPPQETVIAANLSQADMAKVGRQIMDGKGLCLTCHTIGKTEGPFRFPDLANVDVRAKTREAGFSDVDYFAQTLYEPNAFIVPGFNPGMPTINKPPIGLITLQTSHHYYTPPGAPGAAPAPAAASAPGVAPSAPPAPPATTPPPAAPAKGTR